MKNEQLSNEAVDIAIWRREEEFAEYPEGARDKTLVYCSIPESHRFLSAGKRYLFKRSYSRYKEQFWVEIFAYKLGSKMGITVPPAFVAYDSKQNQSGALIEWFLKQDGTNNEIYVPGGDYCQQYISDFDRKKGEKHNFETIVEIFNDVSVSSLLFKFNDDWKNYWAKTFVFDALIGNTDRHQDNWGIIMSPNHGKIYISPVFDNGTSMGHEIYLDKFDYHNDERIKKYIENGRHHMKWELNDAVSMGHLEMLKKLVAKFSETQQTMLTCLRAVNDEIFKSILDDLIAFDVPVRLSAERAAFMLKLLQFRHRQLLSGLEN